MPDDGVLSHEPSHTSMSMPRQNRRRHQTFPTDDLQLPGHAHQTPLAGFRSRPPGNPSRVTFFGYGTCELTQPWSDRSDIQSFEVDGPAFVSGSRQSVSSSGTHGSAFLPRWQISFFFLHAGVSLNSRDHYTPRKPLTDNELRGLSPNTSVHPVSSPRGTGFS